MVCPDSTTFALLKISLVSWSENFGGRRKDRRFGAKLLLGWVRSVPDSTPEVSLGSLFAQVEANRVNVRIAALFAGGNSTHEKFTCRRNLFFENAKSVNHYYFIYV